MSNKYSKENKLNRKIEFLVDSIQQDRELSSLIPDLTEKQTQNTALQTAVTFENRLGPLMTFRLKSITKEEEEDMDDYDGDNDDV